MLTKTPRNGDKEAEHSLLNAAKRGDLEKVKQLLSIKVDINACSPKGYTPLYLAVRYGHTEVVDELLRSEAINLEVKYGDGRTLLFECFLRGFLPLGDGDEYIKIFTKLLKRGANPLAKDSCGNTLLHAAASMKGNEKSIVEISKIIKYLKNLNVANYSADTPLHVATLAGNLNMIELLINHGANYNALNKNNQSPRDLAEEHWNPKVVKLINQLCQPQITRELEKKVDQQQIEIRELRAEIGELKQMVGRLLQLNEVNTNSEKLQQPSSPRFKFNATQNI